MGRGSGQLTSEGEFFRRLDAELADRIRQRAEVDREKQHAAEASIRKSAEFERQAYRMREAAGITDPVLIAELQRRGFTPETVSLLYFIPLIQTAWADGCVSRAERGLILTIASQHGVIPDTPAYDHLLAWLDRRPAEKFLQQAWTGIHGALECLQPDEREVRTASVMKDCKAVAKASGSMWHKICAAEQKLLDRFACELARE